MTPTNTAKETLDRSFLDIRSRILDIAAGLDRVDRGSGGDSLRTDDRVNRIREALAALHDGAANRAERVQMLFSLPYDPTWRKR